MSKGIYGQILDDDDDFPTVGLASYDKARRTYLAHVLEPQLQHWASMFLQTPPEPPPEEVLEKCGQRGVYIGVTPVKDAYAGRMKEMLLAQRYNAQFFLTASGRRFYF